MVKVADYVLNRLTEWDIHRIYGYPGDGINVPRSTGPGEGRSQVHPAAARGDGRVHGHRARALMAVTELGIPPVRTPGSPPGCRR
jgi:hypothetical protein